MKNYYLILLHGFSDPLGEFDAAVVVTGAADTPDEAEDEPGLHQLGDLAYRFPADRFLALLSQVQVVRQRTIRQ